MAREAVRSARNGSFASVEDLLAQVPAFSASFDRTTAKPCNRTYRGKPFLA